MKKLISVGIFVAILYIILFFLHGHVKAYLLDTDLPGMDYRNFDLNVSDPKLCEDACALDQKCKAWTYVKPGIQGPQARCWLKNNYLQQKHNTCCISDFAVIILQLATPDNEPKPLATPDNTMPLATPDNEPIPLATPEEAERQEAIQKAIRDAKVKTTTTIVSKPSRTQAAFTMLPIIEMPTKGQEFSSNKPIKIKVRITGGSTNWYVKLRFERKQGKDWVSESVILGYDTKKEPNGKNVNYEEFGKKGNWRVQAKLSTPANASWTQPVTFRIK